MAYVWITHPPTPEEQARANFWDGLQKLSLFLGVLVAIRSLLE